MTAAQVLDLGVALDDLEAGADLVDAVVDGLELGRLVDDEFAAS